MLSRVKKGYFFPTPESSIARSFILVPFPSGGRPLRGFGFPTLWAGFAAGLPSARLVPGAYSAPLLVSAPPGPEWRLRATPFLAASRLHPHAQVPDTPALR